MGPIGPVPFFCALETSCSAMDGCQGIPRSLGSGSGEPLRIDFGVSRSALDLALPPEAWAQARVVLFLPVFDGDQEIAV